MGGFVIECLLKSLLLDRYPNLEKALDPAKLSSADRKIFGYLYGHELDLMLDALPDVQRKLTRVAGTFGKALLFRLREICDQWTVHARYSTRQAKIAEARDFLDTVSEVKKWLKEF